MYNFFLAGRRAAKRHDNTIDLRDPKAKQEFITSELQKANIKLSEGRWYGSDATEQEC